MQINHIYQGDCINLLDIVDDNSIDLVLTSPLMVQQEIQAIWKGR